MKLPSLTKNLFKNSSMSMIFKVINMLVVLYLVRITLEFLTIEQYAFWIVFLSVLSWVNMMDFGIGTGFRNLYTDSIIKNEDFKNKQLVSSLYLTNTLFTIIVAFIFYILSFVLNINLFETNDLIQLVWIFFLFCVFLIKYISRSISYILLANHMARLNMLLILFENSVSMIWVLFCISNQVIDFSYFILGFISSQLLAVLIFSFFIFTFTNINSPKLKYMNIYVSKKLVNAGLKYFVLQLLSLILFGSLPYLISLFFNSLQIVEFGVTWRLFSAIGSFVMILIGPIWSLFSEAKTTSNVLWMKNIWFKSTYFFCALFLFLGVFLFWIGDFMSLWLGRDLNLEISYFIPFYIYIILFAFFGFHSQILNGFGKLKNSILSTSFQVILYFTICAFFINSLSSPHYVVYFLCISFIFPIIILPITSFKLINKEYV